MAWSAPMTAVAHSIFPAADFNQYVRDNLLETAPAKVESPNFLFSTARTNSIENVPAGTLNVIPPPVNYQLSDFTSNPAAIVGLVQTIYEIPHDDHVMIAQWSWTGRRDTIGGTGESPNTIMYQTGTSMNILRTGWYDVGLIATYAASSGGVERNVALVVTDFGSVTGGIYATFPQLGSTPPPSVQLRGMLHMNENYTLTPWFYQDSGDNLLLEAEATNIAVFWARYIPEHGEV